METIQSEQFTIDGNKDPSVKESLFYMIFLLTIYPMIMGLLSDYFSLQHLSETDISTMGITGSIDTLTTAMSAVFAIGAQAVCAKYVAAGMKRSHPKPIHRSFLQKQGSCWPSSIRTWPIFSWEISAQTGI